MSNGKTIGLIKALGGPGGGGGTSDAVQYIPQELTTEQQMQARKNVGVYYDAKETVTLVDNYTVEISEDYGSAKIPLSTKAVIVGESYDIELDGTVHKCIAKVSESGTYYIGNFAIITGNVNDDTGESFVFTAYEDNKQFEAFFSKTGMYTLTVSGATYVSHQIPKKYIPSDVVIGYTNEGSYNQLYLNEDEGATYEELWRACESGNKLVVIKCGWGTTYHLSSPKHSFSLLGPAMECYLFTATAIVDYPTDDDLDWGSTNIIEGIRLIGLIYTPDNGYTLWGFSGVEFRNFVSVDRENTIFRKTTFEHNCLFLRSPSNKLYQITVDDTGTLSAVEVTE